MWTIAHRGAAFVCAAALVLPDGREFTVRRRDARPADPRAPRVRRLRIRPDLRARRGHPHQRRAAPAEKDAISHRGKAFRALAEIMAAELH